MKVLIINHHFKEVLGGSEIQCDIIADKLVEFGHQVVYLAINGTSNYNRKYKVISVNQSIEEITSAAINEKPDIVYWRFNKRLFRESVKSIHEAKIPIVFATANKNDTRKWFEWEPIKFDRTFAKNILLWLKKLYINKWQYTGFKFVDGVVVNNIAHLNRIPNTKQKHIPNSNISDRKHFQWNRPYICWVSNFKTHKRPELCIEVAKELGEGIDLLMVGEIKNVNYLGFNDKKNLPSNLHYLGPKTVKEVNGIIASSLCLIHTCLPEGFPGNFIQAWLQGKPVVSYEFDPGGIIKSERIGYVADGNMRKFILMIKKIIKNPTLNEKIGVRAKDYANKNFSPDINIKKLENFLLDVINEKSSQQ